MRMKQYKKILSLFLFVTVIYILTVICEKLGFWNAVVEILLILIFLFGLMKFAAWILN